MEEGAPGIRRIDAQNRAFKGKDCVSRLAASEDLFLTETRSWC